MKTNISLILISLLTVFSFSSCSSDEPENDVVKKNNDAFNYFLSQYKVIKDIPTSLETGENAPFYQIDKDGFIFLQVIENKGIMTKDNEKIYFRYSTFSLISYFETHVWPKPTATDETDFDISDSFLTYNSTSTIPTIIPLNYVGNESRVNIAVRQISDKGDFPFLMNISYIPEQIDVDIPKTPVNISFLF